MRKIAAIDIGTNSVLYSLFEVRGRTRLDEIQFERHSPRIGGGLAGRGKPRITEDSYNGLRKICRRIILMARAGGAEEILIAATNPLRLAHNGRQIRKRLEEDLGCAVRILSADEEAHLSFLGAVGRLRPNGRAMIIDLGGGSTEFVVYRGDKRRAFVSIPEGAVSLTEQFASSLKVNPDDFPKFRAYLARYDSMLSEVIPHINSRVVLVGGTSSALGYLKSRDFHGQGAGIYISREEIEIYACLLADLSLGCRRELLAIDKKRAEIIFAGAFWLGYVLKRLGIRRAKATPRGLRHGMALEFLERGRITA